MTSNPLPPSASENLPAYDPQLDTEDAALSSGNTRLGIVVGALFGLGVLAYALVPGGNSGGGLAAVTPSFLLEGASVTASREVTAEAPATTATVAPTAVPSANRFAQPKPAAASAGGAVARPAATVAAPSLAPGPAPLAALEPVAAASVVAPAPTAEPARAAPATLTLSGRILDEDGKPLVGATVLLKGSGKGTSTDANGHYELQAPAGDNSLIFGYGGYQDEEVRVRGAQPENVTLTPTPGAKRRRK